jgi:hypothetical protein
MNSWWRRATGVLIVALIVGLICWELLAFVFGGNPSTFSRVLGDFAATYPLCLFGLGTLNGAAVVHFFGLRQTTPINSNE